MGKYDETVKLLDTYDEKFPEGLFSEPETRKMLFEKLDKNMKRNQKQIKYS